MLPTSTSGKPGAAYVPSLAVSAWRVVTRLAIIGRVSEQSRYVETAEAAWRWVLDQVRWDDGPWIPEAVTDPAPTEPAWDRDGTYSGVGGLALVLCEIRLARPWTAEESGLADAIARRISSRISSQVDYSLFDGLVSDIGVLTALERDGAEAAVDRLTALATPDGWPQTHASPPGYLPDARINDVTLGTAGVLLGALWARRFDVEGATRLAEHAVDVLLAEAEPTSAGTNWSFVPPRFETTPRGQMPNFSHGVAGVAAALAVAGAELDRPDLTDAARSGAEHLLSLGDASGEGLLVPRYLPSTINDEDEFTFTWCHGVSGTSLLFAALDHARGARGGGEVALGLASPLPAQRADLRAAGPAPSGLLGQRRALLRHGGCGRRVPRRVAARGRRGRSRVRGAPRGHAGGARDTRGLPRVLAVHRAPERRSAAASARGLDAGGGGHRRRAVPDGPGAARGPDGGDGAADGHLVGRGLSRCDRYDTPKNTSSVDLPNHRFLR